jgi:predicted Abi (CAAX) family protease
MASIRAAVRSWPTRGQWVACAAAFAGYGIVAGAVGMLSGFFRPGWPTEPPWKLAVLPFLLFVTPSFVEELFFRGVLLPHPRERVRPTIVAIAASFALLAFILWHPLNGLLKPSVLPLFTNPVFLTLATLMGAACTTCYLVSGSIWPPVLVHWATVLVWGLFLGGGSMLGRPTT